MLKSKWEWSGFPSGFMKVGNKGAPFPLLRLTTSLQGSETQKSCGEGWERTEEIDQGW